MPSSWDAWLFWIISTALSGIGVPIIGYFIPGLRKWAFKILEKRETPNELLENILASMEREVYKGNDSAVLTLDVIANSLETNNGIVTIEAHKTVNALIKRTEGKWARDQRSGELPGYAIKAIAKISLKHKVTDGKQYIARLYRMQSESGYVNNKHFWACVTTAYEQIQKN